LVVISSRPDQAVHVQIAECDSAESQAQPEAAGQEGCQFENLRSNIAKLKLANSPTEFPEKLIFGNRDEELIKKRVEDLNQYLEALLALNSPLVQQELFSFIEKSNTNIDSV